MITDIWHDKSIEETLKVFDTPLEGLSSNEANLRIEKYGENKLKEPQKIPGIIRFLSQYHDPMNYLLIGAALLLLAIHPDQLGEPILIGIVLTLNAFYVFRQENQAEKAYDA